MPNWTEATEQRPGGGNTQESAMAEVRLSARLSRGSELNAVRWASDPPAPPTQPPPEVPDPDAPVPVEEPPMPIPIPRDPPPEPLRA